MPPNRCLSRAAAIVESVAAVVDPLDARIWLFAAIPGTGPLHRHRPVLIRQRRHFFDHRGAHVTAAGTSEAGA